MSEAGRKMVRDFLPKLKEQHSPDVVISNCENMAGGKGVTSKTNLDVVQSGVDSVTCLKYIIEK